MITNHVRIGDCVCCNPSVKLTKGQSYPLIDIDKIEVGKKLVRNADTVEFSGQSGSRFEKGDTLMARITPCLENGKMAVADIENKGIGSTELFVFRGIKGVTDNDFVYYLFKQAHIRQLAANSMTGASGRQRADLKFIKRIYIDLPSLPCQREIASILSDYDSLIENNIKRIKTLEQIANALFREWFIRFRFPGCEDVEMIGGIPLGWHIDKVKNVVKRLPYGRVYKPYELSPEGNIIVIDQSTDACLGYHNNEPSHYASLDSPIIIFGDHSCKFQLMTEDFSLGENVIPYIPMSKEMMNCYYLYYATRKLIRTEEYKRHWGRFSANKMIIPPFNIQLQFAEHVKGIEGLLQVLRRENRYLKKQRDLLLPRLMSGKLEVH